ncbi:sodium channel protein Nach [Halyomorpha halys]|uniref:sodium channel protein Nach n=1 Tax=Halyomorpha halys TaxID=286706 RepID=UPI0034D383E3
MPCCSNASVLIPIKTKEYFDHGSIHGLRYITEPNRNITERVFWACVVITAMYGTYSLLRGSWYNFQNNAVSFVVETSYLEWNTTFPAVSICENESPDKIFDSGTRLFGAQRDMNMDFFLRDIAFFDGTCYSCKTHCGNTMNCSEELKYLVEQVRAPCEDFLGNCTWNGVPFDCCSQFLPLQTEIGLCYTINSLHTKSKLKKLELKSNKKTGPGKIRFQVYEAAKLFIHSPDDVPYINHPHEEKAVLNWGTVYSMSFQVNEIDNDAALSEVSVEQRNCRFPLENFLNLYDYYSYSTCVVNCRAKAQIDFCNCTHHFIPFQEGVKMCNIDGLTCLTDNSETLRALRTEDNDKKGLVCNCMSSCVEPEYTIIRKAQITNEDSLDNGTKVSVIMDTLPSQRFKRNVVRTRLDLVVSMGGTAGLFLGASLLSVVELLVYIFFRGNTRKEIQPKTISLENKKPPVAQNVFTIGTSKKINSSNNPNLHIKEYLKYR